MSKSGKSGCVCFKDAVCLCLVIWGVVSWPDSQSFLKLSGNFYRQENSGRAAEISYGGGECQNTV